MKCPYCNKELAEGYIYSPRTLCWTTEVLKTFSESWLTKEGNIVLSESDLFHPGRAVAYNCFSCKRMIIAYGEEG